jgi:hypothetical protein
VVVSVLLVVVRTQCYRGCICTIRSKSESMKTHPSRILDFAGLVRPNLVVYGFSSSDCISLTN